MAKSVKIIRAEQHVKNWYDLHKLSIASPEF